MEQKESKSLTTEARINFFSLLASLFLFFLTAAIGLAIDSITLLLASSKQLVDVIIGFFYHKVIATLELEPNHRYHFGFAKYEPLTAFLSGILIVSFCVLNLKYAIQDIIHPEEVTNYLAAIVLASMTAVISFILVAVLRRYARVLHSSILKMLAVDWFNDAISALGITVGFLLGRQFSHQGHTRSAAYTDPVMSIILAGFLVVEPIKLIRSNMEDLLDVNPGKITEEKAQNLAESMRQEFHLPGIQQLRLRKAGRKVFLEIKFFIRPETTAEEWARLTSQLTATARQTFPCVDVTVSLATVRNPETRK